MNKTPYYTGGADPGSTEARHLARPLNKQHPDLRGYIFSAAAFLIRDGQPPTDSRVLEEARRRKKRADAMYKRARERMAENKAKRDAA